MCYIKYINICYSVTLFRKIHSYLSVSSACIYTSRPAGYNFNKHAKFIIIDKLVNPSDSKEILQNLLILRENMWIQKIKLLVLICSSGKPWQHWQVTQAAWSKMRFQFDPLGNVINLSTNKLPTDTFKSLNKNSNFPTQQLQE